MILRDTAKHQGLRNQLASVLKNKGITDEKVLDAIRSIPRHLFIDSSFEDHAYQDKAFPIAADQTISQPYTVAFQSQTLQISKGDKIYIEGRIKSRQWQAEDGATKYTTEIQVTEFTFLTTKKDTDLSKSSLPTGSAPEDFNV